MDTDLTAAIEAAAYDAADRTIDAIEQRKDFVFNGMFDPEVREIALAVLAAVEPLIAERAAADERERIARAIEDELVCCDIADRIRAVATDSIAVTKLMDRGAGYHPICHWGGAAAAIARRPETA